MVTLSTAPCFVICHRGFISMVSVRAFTLTSGGTARRTAVGRKEAVSLKGCWHHSLHPWKNGKK